MILLFLAFFNLLAVPTCWALAGLAFARGDYGWGVLFAAVIPAICLAAGARAARELK